MRTTTRVAGAVLALGLGLVAAACGSDPATRATDPAPSKAASTTPSKTSAASLADRPWLLRFNLAGGGEGDTTVAVYVRFTPSTGATSLHRLPGIDAPDTYSGSQALMVSADQKYALLDSAVLKADAARGRISLYPTLPGKKVFLDVRAITGRKNLRPVAAAFDPVAPEVLRVVDATRAIWRIDVASGKATRAGSLPHRRGWIFANTFDKNTGLPFIADINTSATDPAGNGDDDTRPVERRGGELWTDLGNASGKPAFSPAPPCGFGSGFVEQDGTRWIFCADTPSLTAYRLAKGDEKWAQVGVASKAVLPGTVDELPVVLPPV